MAGRSDQLRQNAEECARRAEQSSDPLIRQEFFALARRFAELAEHIDRRARRTDGGLPDISDDVAAAGKNDVP